MQKIYVDPWVSQIIDDDLDNLEIIEDINQVPDCDTIAMVFYDGDLDSHLDRIRYLSSRSRRLIVIETEPVSYREKDFINHVDLLGEIRAEVWSDSILNQPRDHHGTAISWFVTNRNYYASSKWPHWESWREDMINSINLDHRPRQFKFDCLLGTSRPHRDLVAQHWESSDCKDQILFNYFRHDIQTGTWPPRIDSHDLSMTAGLVRYNGLRVPLSAILPFHIYNQSHYSIVAETTCSNDYSHFTEKVAKPMIARRPFVAFAGQYYLRNLKRLGFQTFDSVIDESYDEIENHDLRISRAWKEVEILCQRDPESTHRSLQSVLDHNFNHFINTDWYSDLKQSICHHR
jgi:hypothetical protein